MIAIDGLTVRFGTSVAVADVSLAIPEGGAFGIVGESGSGKSTVLRAVAGLVPIAAGRILRDGKPLAGAVQMVFQDPYGSLHPRHTVERALREPIAVRRLGDAETRILAALADVGLELRHRFRFPHQLSGGQRQRVAIARALLASPMLLLLDEPTAALDVLAQAEIVALLQRLRRARGMAFLLVSHDLAVAAQLCERIAVMQAGRIVEELDAAALAAGQGAHPLTRQLIAASGLAPRPDDEPECGASATFRP